MESCFGLGFDCLKNLNKKLPALVNFNWSQGNASNESLKVVAMCMPNVETLQFNYVSPGDIFDKFMQSLNAFLI